VRAVFTGWLTGLDFHLACLLALYFPNTFGAISIVNKFLVTSFSLPFSELSLVGLDLDPVH